MKLPLLRGSDFRWNDEYPDVAVVNETFARRYFGNENPIGHTFEALAGAQGAARVRLRIIGVAADARYEDMRLPIPATFYVPLRGAQSETARNYARATFLVRTAQESPLSIASTLRRAIPAAGPEIRVSNIVTQSELIRLQMIRESLLAALSIFFAVVALILAGIGLYGVLNYAVLERRRELGIRIALGAPSGDIVRIVSIGAMAMVVLGAAIGIAAGLAATPYIATLLYRIKPGDPRILALPLLTIFGAALTAVFARAARHSYRSRGAPAHRVISGLARRLNLKRVSARTR